MASSPPSLKDVTKAIYAALPTVRIPLPEDLVEIIEGYVQSHEEPDEGLGEKVHEELLAIYRKEILGQPSRYGPFLNILRRFRPILATPERTLQWWDLMQPATLVIDQEKDLAAEGQATLLDILTADWGTDVENPGGGGATPLAEKILTAWLEGCNVAGRAEDQVGNLKEKQLREILVLYGKKRPRDFMTVVDKFMVKKEFRARTLHLMADFIRSRPPHLYQIHQTPLFGTLINCLQLDTSTTIISLALTVLTMVLPHMPTSLVPHLPTLFNIYARLLFWKRELSASEFGMDTTAERRLSPSAAAWDKKTYSPEFDDTAIPHLLNYFTILYGLYPINFMDYIRKPQRYLRHAEVPNSDDVDLQPTEIRHASEQFRQCHLLHENFYTLTIESEKTDFGRWIKSEPAEVVAECMGLLQPIGLGAQPVALSFGFQEPPALSIQDEVDREAQEAALLSSSVPLGASPFGDGSGNTQSIPVGSPNSSLMQTAILRKSSQSSHRSQRDSSSTRPSGQNDDSPTLNTTGSYTHLQDLINSNKVIKSSLNQSLANDSAASLALSHQESISERATYLVQPNSQSLSTPISTTENGKDLQIRHLYRQILLLYNDLTFERFMKQQHLTHMGELRRRQVREAASEAEAQNLIMQNRTLKKRLDEAKKNEIQVKKDSERSRALAKKWEADLSAKLRTIREEQKKWQSEGESLRKDLEKATIEADSLRKLVCDGEVRELGWKQTMEYVETNANELERLKQEVDRLTETERNFQAQEIEREVAKTRAADAEGRAELLQMKLTARDAEVQQTHDLYQSQIVVLNAKLQDALKNGAERRADGLKAQLESALSASRAQQAELKKRITDLIRKNTSLNATLLELQSTMPTRVRSDPPRPSSSDGELSPRSSGEGSPLSFRNRQHRGVSDPESFEATSYNPTPPLGPFDAVLGNSIRRPSTPSGTEGSGSFSGKTSPTLERYHGRGGIQNVVRKDKKEKKDDKKKSSGIRGIRGFG